ncbi:MAG: pyridoxal-phosphate dependent enzyme [Thermodesulfobacteriota bacterium]|nr:pyridoxal-phosphate dependent enzyme [Thermodesulfobacteriota bacterium]
MAKEPTIKEIRNAYKRIRPYIHRTPVLTCNTLNQICKADLFFKCDNFQKGGAFKIRGATNAVFSYKEKANNNGVATHSSGNHGAAVALAARWKGIKSYVVMPENSPNVKKAAVANYGAKIIFCKPTLQAREESLANVIDDTGADFIHPYNDYRVIAGQGTAALELCEEIPNLDIIIAPVGGGGLVSGTAIAVSAVSPETHIIAAEPENADDAYQSFRAGEIIPSQNPDTIADGLRTSLGDLTFPIIKKYVKAIVTVSEERIAYSMRLIWERMKIIVEPSSAVTLGALLTEGKEFSNKRIGIIISGGNVDLGNLPWAT